MRSNVVGLSEAVGVFAKRLSTFTVDDDTAVCPYLPTGADMSRCEHCDGIGNLTDGVDYVGECPHYAAAMVEARVRAYWNRLPANLRAAMRAMRDEFAWGQSREWEPEGYRKCLVLTGQVGTGKTVAMHRHVIQLMRSLRQPVHVVQAVRFESDVHCMVDDPGAASRVAYSLRRCQDDRCIVAIDDIGRERDSRAVSDRIAAMLFELHQRTAPAIITTNLPGNQLAARYGDHIYDRLIDRQWTTVVTCCGENARRAK